MRSYTNQNDPEAHERLGWVAARSLIFKLFGPYRKSKHVSLNKYEKFIYD